MIIRSFTWWMVWAMMLLFSDSLSGQSSIENRLRLNRVNTAWPEKHPSISFDGRMLYFSRIAYPANMGSSDEADVWYCFVENDSTCSIPVNAGVPVNSIFPDFPVANSISGYQLRVLRKEELSLFFAISGNLRHKTVEELPTPAFSYPDAEDFFVSSDGQLLFFSMEAAQGYGGKDIYVAYLEADGTWGAARNLGSALNSRGDETTPFLAADGKTLYFSSDGRGGFGGKDLFVSFSMSDEHWNEWTIPQNLGPGINAETDETHPTLAASGEQILFCASAVGTDSSDIYRAPIPQVFKPQPLLLVSGNYHPSLRITRLDTSITFVPKLYHTLETEGERFRLILPRGADVELYTNEPGYFWCTHVLELGYEPLESIDSDEEALSTLLESAEYRSREEQIHTLQVEWMNRQEKMEKLQREQERLLKDIGQQALGISINTPNPTLEINRIVLMLSALPDTFVQEVTIALNKKRLALLSPDSTSTPDVLLSPEAEKQIVQKMIFGIRNFIDAHNSKLELEREQASLKATQLELLNQQIDAEKLVVGKPKVAPNSGSNQEESDKGALQKFEEIELPCDRIPIKAGQTKVLQHIYFEENTAQLKKYAQNELNRLVDMLKKNTSIALEISAHTHTGLGHTFARQLSRKRAETVAGYLVEKGISRERLQVRGYGKMYPLESPDTTIEQKKLNQRIEIRILK